MPLLDRRLLPANPSMVAGLAQGANAPQLAPPPLGVGAQRAGAMPAPGGPSVPPGGVGGVMPPSEAPEPQGLMSRFLGAPRQGEALGLLGSYLMMAGARTTDPGARTKYLAEGLREYAATLRGQKGEGFTLSKGASRHDAAGNLIAENVAAPEAAGQGKRITVEEGNETVTYWVGPDGTRQEIGRAPRWQPPAAAKTPEEIERDAAARARGTAAGTPPSGALVQVYDPNSPTGTTYVPRSQAEGRPGRPGMGAKLSVGADGEVDVTFGPGAGMGGDSGLSRGALTKAQNTLIGARESVARLQEVARTFKDEWQELPTIASDAWAGFRARLGRGNLTPEERRTHAEITTFRQVVANNRNKFIKWAAGTAVSAAEGQRADMEVPKAAAGIFEWGDDPVAFKAKLEGAMAMSEGVIARYDYYLKQGITDPEEMARRSPIDSIEIRDNPDTGESWAYLDGDWQLIE